MSMSEQYEAYRDKQALRLEIARLREGIQRAAESCTDPVCKRHLNELLKGEA